MQKQACEIGWLQMLLDQSCRSLSRSLARYLAASVAEDLKPPQRRRFVDPGVMARCCRGRIGEAANQLQYVAIQSKVRASFLDWLHKELSQETWESICRSPRLQVIFLRSYGNWLYSNGQAMHLFRHLVVFCQQQFPAERHQIQPAWELLHRWEAVQPVSHRPRLPKLILDAMLCLALSWGWCRWAFFGACRVGEPLSHSSSERFDSTWRSWVDRRCMLSQHVCSNVQPTRPGPNTTY